MQAADFLGSGFGQHIHDLLFRIRLAMLRAQKHVQRKKGRMQGAMEAELSKQQPKRDDLEARRAKLVDRLKQSTVSARVDEDKESDYGIYRKLYDDMKVKLEQAITSRDLGSGSQNQFLIIDPALLPVKPTKPNRPQLIVAGMLIGLFFGLVAVIVKELLDTTVRTPRDVEVFQKPVIAFITDGRRRLPE